MNLNKTKKEMEKQQDRKFADLYQKNIEGYNKKHEDEMNLHRT